MKVLRGCMRIIYGILILVSGFNVQLSASDEPKTNLVEIFNLIYEQQFSTARYKLTSSRDSLDKWEYEMLDLDLLFWQAITNNTKYDYDQLELRLRAYSSDLSKKDDNDMVEELIILSYSFRFQAIKGRFIALMVDFLRINRIVQHIETDMLKPDQQEIYTIYLALYNIGKSKLILNTSKLTKESICTLESYLNYSNPVYQTVVRYFLSKIYLEVEQSPVKAKLYCEQLCSSYPTNKIFNYNLRLCDK